VAERLQPRIHPLGAHLHRVWVPPFSALFYLLAHLPMEFTAVPTSNPTFRQRLDAVLRRRDPVAVRTFLIAEGQWEATTTTDPARAMWLMIATSPALRDLHAEATHWLADHGFASEARMLEQSDRRPPVPRRPHAGRSPASPRDRPRPEAPQAPRKP
jgi:hypothetical protein